MNRGSLQRGIYGELRRVDLLSVHYTQSITYKWVLFHFLLLSLILSFLPPVTRAPLTWASASMASPMQSPTPTLPSPPSEMEAELYYHGLPSAPRLVARTGTTPWEAPTGPKASWKCKELRPVYEHALRKALEGSIDILRIGYDGERSAPVVFWIGVTPGSLSGDDGVIVVSECQELLKEYNINDVEVEIRESVVIRAYYKDTRQ